MKKFAITLLLLVIFSEIGITQDSGLQAELAKRRQEVSKSIGKNSVLVVFSAPEQPKTGDVSYEYRQSNSLYYLTGISQPGTTLVLMPGNPTRSEFIFVSDRDPSDETWTGKILSHEEVKQISGIQNVFSSGRFEEFVDSVFNQQPFDVYRYVPSREFDEFFKVLSDGQAMLYLVVEQKPGLNGKLTEETKFANKIRERFIGISIRDAWPILTRLRQIKSDYELKMLKEAIDITGEALQKAYRTAKAGAWEYEVEAVIEETFKRRNAFDWAFPSIVASGPNATTLHYEQSQRQMKDGELLLMDLGAEYQYYAADITRTIPVNGKFSTEQAEIYNIVLEAQEASMKAVKPGAALPQVHLAGTEVVKQGLKKLGLITDTTGDQYKIWFMHGVSHWLGMDVHDTGERWRSLEPGMVFTIEPGIYLRSDALDYLSATPENEKFKAAVRPAFEKYKNIGVRIEDDVAVTADGYEMLSGRAPRTIAEIEEAMKK
jgi:Xaa-Pro aminopeptidase